MADRAPKGGTPKAGKKPHEQRAPHGRCTATNRSGAQCGRSPIPGGNVCNMHGGKAPQVRESARRRLLEALDPAAAALVKIATANDPDVPAAARVRAIEAIMDRAGLPKTEKLEHTGEDGAPLEVIVARETRRRLQDLFPDDPAGGPA